MQPRYMAANAEIITNSFAKAISLRWIISARDDLVWFIGSVVTSYILFLLYVSGVLPLVVMAAFWAIFVDAPHVFGTFSRTYFDREERKNRPALLWGSLLFFVVGPVMVSIGLGLLFFFIAALWAYYHLVKQHYGFMVLYKKKNDDLAKIDNVLDRLFLLFAFNSPFVAFIARDPSAMARVPQVLRPGVSGLSTALLIVTVLLGVVWLVRQVQRAIIGEPLNVPKYLLFAAAIPMHWVVLLTPMPNQTIAIVAILTIYHNLQYHRLIWFHNKKYTASPDANYAEKQAEKRKQYGAAELISRTLLYYIAFGIIFGIFYQGPRQLLGYFSWQKTAAGTAQPFASEMLVSFLWGFAFIHYYLDSKIWRVRRDPNVGKALHM